MRKILYFFCFVIMTACNLVFENTNVIQVDVSKARSINFSDWFFGVDIIPLETNEYSLMYSCNKIVCEHERFYIHDFRQHAVFVFDTLGNFLFSTMPLKGQATGQYISMTDFWISPFTGNMEIFDAYSQLIRVYDKDGKFLNNIILDADLLPMGKFIQLTTDLYLFYSTDYEKKEKTSIKVFSVSKRKIVDNIVPLPDNTHFLSVSDLLVFKRLKNDILFSHNFFNNDIWQIDTTASIVSHYQYNFGKYTFQLKTLLPDRDASYYARFITENKNNYIFPYKKHENAELSGYQKRFNPQLGSYRIFIEHVNRSIKRFKILQQLYRNKQKKHLLRLPLISGLHNFELQF